MTYNEFERECDDLEEALRYGDIDEDDYQREYEGLVERYGDNK